MSGFLSVAVGIGKEEGGLFSCRDTESKDVPCLCEGCVALLRKQQFSVFGQRPDFVVNLHLQVVDVVADAVEEGSHGFFVSKGAFFVVRQVVGHFARFDHVVHQFLDSCDAV